jgi:CPA2 family monovalent cation:H+ antiporter-2/glutathione-regulated potassium-efflux system protein KefB
MLETLVALLAATAIAVPVSRRLGFGSIVGYLVAGALIGPSGLRLVTGVDQIASVSELGVVMLLFLIGLELRPHRLWILRKAVFGLGLGQMLPTTLLLAALAGAAGVPWRGAAVLGAGLALSSTAIVLPMLGERNLLSSTAGRDSFAVLLFQDMAFIPLVALVPLLAGDGGGLQVSKFSHVPWRDVARGVGAIAAILLGGSFLVRPLFRAVGGAKTPEVFTATALLLVAGTAALAGWAGLSMSLGAFMAGVLLSDSEFRHELQADIEPFEGLLLGFFFISVGMSANLALAVAQPGHVAIAVAALIASKILVAFLAGLIKRGSAQSALRFSLALPEGSEFSFVLFAAAVSAGVLAQDDADMATLAVALSMVAAPMLFTLSERLVIPRLGRRKEPAYDRIDGPATPVIICGFGRVGQIVGRVLHLQGISFTALEKDAAQVEAVRRFGQKVYFGNPARAEVMRAAGAETAKVLVVAMADMEETILTVAMAKRHFPNLAIYARARNRRHAHRLMDIGIKGIIRETFFSSLRLTEMVLADLEVPPDTVRRVIDVFQQYDERNLEETHAIATDEQQLIQNTQQATAELMELLEADRVERAMARQARPRAGAAPR